MPVKTTSARDPDLTVRIILLQYFISKIKPHVHKVYCHRITFCTRNSFEIFIKVLDINWSIWSSWFEIIASHLYKLMKMLIFSFLFFIELPHIHIPGYKQRCWLFQGTLTYEVIGYFSAPGYFTVNSNGEVVLLSSLASDTALSYTVSTHEDQASRKDETCFFSFCFLTIWFLKPDRYP